MFRVSLVELNAWTAYKTKADLLCLVASNRIVSKLVFVDVIDVVVCLVQLASKLVKQCISYGISSRELIPVKVHLVAQKVEAASKPFTFHRRPQRRTNKLI